jgi:hypothetical protein
MAGRPPASSTVSNAVLTRNALAVFDATPRELYAAMNDSFEWIKWLAEHRLIRNNNDCTKCHCAMGLVRRAESPDGYSWSCRTCRTRTSVRTGSFFAKCSLSLEKIVMLIYFSVFDVQSKHVMMFESITDWHIIVNYNNFFRAECEAWITRQQVWIGGFDGNGQPMYVEVDETYFFPSKYHRGRHRRGCWVFGDLTIYRKPPKTTENHLKTMKIMLKEPELLFLTCC